MFMDFFRALFCLPEPKIISKPKTEWPDRVKGHCYDSEGMFDIVSRLHYAGHNSHTTLGGKLIHEIQRTPFYVLREVELPNCINGGLLRRMVVREYASMTTPFPPIVVGRDGAIIDGWHRIHAARERGDRSIQAYVPEKYEGQIRFEV